jgi:hypothetical protein
MNFFSAALDAHMGNKAKAPTMTKVFDFIFIVLTYPSFILSLLYNLPAHCWENIIRAVPPPAPTTTTKRNGLWRGAQAPVFKTFRTK